MEDSIKQAAACSDHPLLSKICDEKQMVNHEKKLLKSISVTGSIKTETTIYDLNRSTLLHIMNYLTLPDVISLETLGNNIFEASKDHYARNYKSFTISHKFKTTVNHFEWVDIEPAQTYWQKFIKQFSIALDRTSHIEQFRSVLKRIGPYIQQLYIIYGELSIEEIAVICDLVHQYCVCLKGNLYYIGPMPDPIHVLNVQHFLYFLFFTYFAGMFFILQSFNLFFHIPIVLFGICTVFSYFALNFYK